MAKKSDDFEKALSGKRIPILTLDNNWHRLFTQTEPTPRIKELEEELNELLKTQGKFNTEQKDLKALKKKLMDEIVETMEEIGDGKPSKKSEKKMEDNNVAIEDIKSLEDLHKLPFLSKEDLRESICQCLKHTIESQDIPVTYLSLSLCRKICRIIVRNYTVHIPLNISNIS